MATIVQVRSLQPWRIAVTLDSGTPSTTAGNYTITRTDGVTTLVTAALAWLTGTNTVDLALSEALLDGVAYTVAVVGSGSASVAYRAPSLPEVDPQERDLNAQRLGLDVAWASSPALDSRRDVPRRVGRDCVRHDLAAVALIDPTEIFHRPQAGAGLRRYTNASSAKQSQAAAVTRSAWSRDPRVKTGSVTVTPRMDPGTGELDMVGDIVLGPTNEPLDVGTDFLR